ncbi:hypothetical protein ACEQ8H_006288 [Pleosporales sp. CAS-2024a]
MRSTLATILALSSTALAHGGITLYTIDEKPYPGYIWYQPYDGQKDLIQRTWHQNPITDPASPNLTCNYHGATVAGAYHAPVAAGSTIRAQWNAASFGWVHRYGPMMAYMASCGADDDDDDDCTSVTDTAALAWFKIAEQGLRDGYAVGDAEGWFQDDLWENQRTHHWDVRVPAQLRAGRYMLRHEIVNLELSPVQFYPNCAQLQVTGEGEAVPGQDFLVKFPGGYKVTDPGIAIAGKVSQNMVTRNYTVPGPKVWTT